MPTLNIKDPEVYELASALARRRGTSMTAVVREALQQAVAAEQRLKEGRVDRIMAIARRSAARDVPFLTDEDLYDDNGLPR